MRREGNGSKGRVGRGKGRRGREGTGRIEDTPIFYYTPVPVF